MNAATTAPKNDRFLRALRREPVDRTPVWLMRQAGRYLPEYRATRAAAGSFLGMAKNPELRHARSRCSRCAVFRWTRRSCSPTSSPCPTRWAWACTSSRAKARSSSVPVRTHEDIARLAVPDMDRELRYVTDAVRTIRRELDGAVPLIGFSGSPWTLACYMVEGGGSDNFSQGEVAGAQRPGGDAPPARRR